MPSTAEVLNRDCACITVDRDALKALLDRGEAMGGVYDSILAKQPHLFASVPVFLGRSHVDAMLSLIDALEQTIALPAFRDAALRAAPPIARLAPGPLGVFYGYDFHLGADGPQLIEINTNSGGPLLNAALAQAQKACCPEMKTLSTEPLPVESLRDVFVAMFRKEWSLQRGADAPPLRTIAIVDQSPETQYLYPEFLLFQEMFRGAGLEAVIVAPDDLVFDGGVLRTKERNVDLVYNRLTDFYLEGETTRALRDAYVAGAVVVTPHPRGHALYADKRHLTVLSDAAQLAILGVDPATIATLVAGVPRTELVTADNRDRLWAQRKKYFFKTIAGYGGKAAYRGEKLTSSVWEAMRERAYVAQALVRPSERRVDLAGERVALKLDIRAYVYNGAAQLFAARLYQGQMTNFRTRGGGFAPVLTQIA